MNRISNIQNIVRCFKCKLNRLSAFLGLLFLLFYSVNSTFAQHSFQRTITVDKKQNAADEDSIQDAIDSISQDPITDKWTILIYAGEYNENVTLDGEDENIDLIGIDREAVIIKPTLGKGIVITSGTETERNNSIRNLTVVTASGHGIEIDKGTSTPKNVTIENVTVKADGTNAAGIIGVDAEHVSLTNCTVTSDDGDGVRVGNHWSLANCHVETIEDSTINQDAVSLNIRSFLTVVDCDIFGERRGIFLFQGEDCLVQNSRITTGGAGSSFAASFSTNQACKRILVQNCLIVSDATLTSTSRPTPIGVFFDGSVANVLENIVFQSCRIIAIGDDDSGSILVTAVRHDISGVVNLIDCSLVAENRKTTNVAQAAGVINGDVRLFGGVIETTSSTEKETDVWDLQAKSEAGVFHHKVSGTRFSKWRGSIESSERPRSVVQRTINVGVPTNSNILTAHDLIPDDEQEITTGIMNPDVYRVLSIQGNKAGMDQEVFIVGTNWAGDSITEKITLEDTLVVDGVRPFKTVTKVILPPQNSSGEKVSVGTTALLGLYYPIASTGKVLQQGRKASGASSYTLQTLNPLNVDETYSTVDVGTITMGDSFEWAILTIQ